MKIPHRLPENAGRRPDPEWAARVEREALEHTDKMQRRYEAAQRRLARAQEKAQAAERRADHADRVRKLWAVVEERRQELIALASLAGTTPAGSTNRGSGSYRGVPGTRPL